MKDPAPSPDDWLEDETFQEAQVRLFEGMQRDPILQAQRPFLPRHARVLLDHATPDHVVSQLPEDENKEGSGSVLVGVAGIADLVFPISTFARRDRTAQIGHLYDLIFVRAEPESSERLLADLTPDQRLAMITFAFAARVDTLTKTLKLMGEEHPRVHAVRKRIDTVMNVRELVLHAQGEFHKVIPS